MNEKMIYLTALFFATRINVVNNYRNKFDKGEKVSTIAQTVQLDWLRSFYQSVGLITRSEQFTRVSKDGFLSATVTPDLIAPRVDYGMEDLLRIQAGTGKTMVNGTMISTVEAIEAKLVKQLKAIVSNTEEALATDIFLNGKFTDATGSEVTMDIPAIQTLNIPTGESAVDKLDDIIIAYQNKHGIIPAVAIGRDLYRRIRQEGKGTNQNLSNVSFRNIEMDGVQKQMLFVDERMIEILVDSKGLDGEVIDTSRRVTLYDPLRLSMVYAGLSYGDVATNTTRVEEAEVIVSETVVTPENGNKGLFAQSAPLPMIVDNNTFIRYDYTT